ncbi:MAG: NAD kinase [Pseudomonadota bacterium]
MRRDPPQPGEIAFVASDRPDAQSALQSLSERYGNVDRQSAKVIVALGGDGTMLEVLRDSVHHNAPVYGINCGTVGFLMNPLGEIDDLPRRIATADRAEINPIGMDAKTVDGTVHSAGAINEVALLRQTRQTARIAIRVNGDVRLQQLICDGILLSTPAGSTAYNLSAHGPILPINANLLALTPISAFRPRRWRGALLPYDAEVTFEVIDADFRKCSATADNVEVRDVAEVTCRVLPDQKMTILFDHGTGLEERILREQFED